jgi:hypothetical protein
MPTIDEVRTQAALQRLPKLLEAVAEVVNDLTTHVEHVASQLEVMNSILDRIADVPDARIQR